ncbi:hypothetical protein VTJ49DRAFT_7545 [Mycothermus thermophilus]|uniref:Uncharacterized protein n=1 Tax=Humicola insolens TaxID=85995 RepID=A0ABR3VJ87_HUMIN
MDISENNFPGRTSIVVQNQILTPAPSIDVVIAPDDRFNYALTGDSRYYIRASVQLLFHGGSEDGLPVPRHHITRYLMGTTHARPQNLTMDQDGYLSMTFQWNDLRLLRSRWFRFQVELSLCYSSTDHRAYPGVEDSSTIDVGEEFWVEPDPRFQPWPRDEGYYGH